MKFNSISLRNPIETAGSLPLSILMTSLLVMSSPMVQAEPTTSPQQIAAPTPSSSTQSTLQVGASSELVPAGTMLTIAFNSHMDSRVTETGEPFTVSLQEDFYAQRPGTNPGQTQKRIILPKGTLLRGRVDTVRRPGLFSRGGSINLTFDHVVLPSGELMPLELNLSTNQDLVNQKGALYSDPGIGKKVNKGVREGIGTFQKITDAGVQAGKGTAGGLGTIVTVPVAATGGAVAGVAVTTGKAVVALVGRGDSVVINPGDTLRIDFGGTFNLPAD